MRQLARQFRRRYGRSVQRWGYRSGLMALSSRLRGHHGAIVLMYHSVAAAPESDWIDPQNHLAPHIFEQQMEYLHRHKRVVSLRQLAGELLSERRVPADTVAITFDDGYRDNLTVAAPILKAFDLPATLFLPTAYIDDAETQWIDAAYSAFTHRAARTLKWGGAEPRDYDLSDTDDQARAYARVCQDLLSATYARRRTLLAELRGQLACEAVPPRLTLDWDEVRQLLADYPSFELGGHTVEHTDLTGVSVEHAVEEVRACFDRIEQMTGVRVREFSFCYGRTSPELRDALAGLGVQVAMGSGGRDPVITPSASPVRLPRVAAPPTVSAFPMAVSAHNTGLWRRLGRV